MHRMVAECSIKILVHRMCHCKPMCGVYDTVNFTRIQVVRSPIEWKMKVKSELSTKGTEDLLLYPMVPVG